jgi:murein DD-endopeptidase MepM/ murein hydrolase activator NlpD
VIRHADGLFSILGHIHQASLKVRVGDAVKAGQPVAAIGASGSSLFPHLHYQLMTGPSMRDEGAPSGFAGLTRVRGAVRTPITNGAIDSGDVVDGR